MTVEVISHVSHTTARFRKARLLAVGVVIALTAAACSDAGSESNTSAVEIFQSKLEFPDIDKLKDSADVVFLGQVIDSDVEYRVVPADASVEGFTVDSGDSIFGAVTFEVLESFKGTTVGDKQTLVFETGAFDTEDKGRRVLYVYDSLGELQLPSGELRDRQSLSNKTFVVFAVRNAGRYVPIKDESALVLAHPDSVGVVLGSGLIRFGSVERSSDGELPGGELATLESIRELAANKTGE